MHARRRAAGRGQAGRLQIICPRHGARFDVRTGAATLPAFEPAPTYEVKVENGDLLVESF